MSEHAVNTSRVAASPRSEFDERAVTVVSALVLLLGVYLLFRELPMTGVTWDESTDFDIARDFVRNQSFLTNLQDPSQGRLSHIVAAASFALLGESYLAFKLPFALIGALSGVWLWRFLRKLVRPSVAMLVAAMYFTCPYVLAASRAGATAGDSLVLATTLGFVITLHRWIETGRFWPHGAACGVICGLATGAKWTSGLLLVAAGIAWVVSLLRKRRFFDGQVWTGLLAQQWVAVCVAVVASPTLLLGWNFIEQSLHHSIQFEGMTMLVLGEMRNSAPFYYLPAVLVSKFSPVQLLVFGYELMLVVVGWVTARRRAGMLRLVAILSLLPMAALLTKGFQNAHYYVATVPAVMLLSALTLERWLKALRASARRAVLWLGTLSLLAQAALSVDLAPDYLLAGRQFGEVFYGQFAGPAVNHCQGLPYAIREMNELIEDGQGPRTAYVLRSCDGIFSHLLANGPVQSLASIAPAPKVSPNTPHFLIIPRSYDYDNLGQRQADAFAQLKAEMTSRCTRVGQGHVDYDLWLCSAG